MATKQQQTYDECMSQIDEMLNNFDLYQANAVLDGVIKGLMKVKESEEKSMLHNVTVKREENKVLEEFWVMKAERTTETIPGGVRKEWKEQELDHEPTPNEIAQFLSDSKADFVSVVQNYRFENELPF